MFFVVIWQSSDRSKSLVYITLTVEMAKIRGKKEGCAIDALSLIPVHVVTPLPYCKKLSCFEINYRSIMMTNHA